MSFDHFLITVPSDKYEPLIEWCKASFVHLGFEEAPRPIPQVTGLGPPGKAWFWISALPIEGVDPQSMEALLKRQHIALKGSIDEIKKFHEAGIKAGGTDNGAPGPRPMYGPNYYGAFVRDPVCGINFEVVDKSYNGQEG